MTVRLTMFLQARYGEIQLEQTLFNLPEVRSKCGIFHVVKYMQSMATICFV